jgi:excisionase family DNA binding protein
MLAEKRIVAHRVERTPLPQDTGGSMTSEGLLELYLTLPHKQREQRFADTARAAELTGLTQRTIQLWIEFGAINAIPIGRKYKIDLDSLKLYLRSRVDSQA